MRSIRLAKGAVELNSGLAILEGEAQGGRTPRAQTLMNSFTDAMMNCEFNLLDMFSKVTKKLLAKQGLPCELEMSCVLQLLGAHHQNLCKLQLSSGKEVPTEKAWDLNLNLQ